MSKNKTAFNRFSLLALCFFMFIIWVIYMANTGQNNIIFQLVRAIPYGDKLGHFFLFGLLTLAFNFGLKFRRIKTSAFFWGTALVFSFVVLEEASQYWIPTRTLDGIDLLGDVLGIGLFDFISRRYCNYKRFQHTKP